MDFERNKPKGVAQNEETLLDEIQKENHEAFEDEVPSIPNHDTKNFDYPLPQNVLNDIRSCEERDILSCLLHVGSVINDDYWNFLDFLYKTNLEFLVFSLMKKAHVSSSIFANLIFPFLRKNLKRMYCHLPWCLMITLILIRSHKGPPLFQI